MGPIMSKVTATVLPGMVGALIKVLPKDIVVDAMDAFLDKIERAVEKSENKIDDKVVLPVCNLIRTSLNIPDGND